jgi:hypothetical protein
MKAQIWISIVVLIAASFACSLPHQSYVTATPTLSPTMCPFVQNPGPPPPEVVKRAQDTFAAMGIAGDLRVSGEGEYTCNEFHLRSVSFEFSLDVSDLKDIGAMKTLAARINAFPVKEVLGNTNFGGMKLRFKAGGMFCWWDDVQGCGPVIPFLLP